MLRSLKVAIWVYIVLLIFEGSLRKWIVPSLADPLLIVRDPIALLIYVLAAASGRFPRNGFVMVTFVLAVMSAFFSFLGGQDNFLVTLYGIRINYFHIPLIWVIGQTFTRKDVERVGIFMLLVVIPMVILMVLQFRSPMDAPINRGVGSEEGGQIFGAAGRIRPPGFFSFITGPQLYFPLVAAFFLSQVSGKRRLWLPLLIACGLAILVALPISISRTVVLATGIVGLAFAACLPWSNTGGLGILRAILLTGIVMFGVSFLPIFAEGREVFLMRWETAASSTDGDAWESIVGRILGGLTQPLVWAAKAPFFGNGIGMGSNVGARLLSGRVGFLLAEDEWGKIFLELGPLLGGSFILLRLAITAHLGVQAVTALLTKRDNLPCLVFAACAIPLAQSQWAPPTILGFAVLGGGLVLAALRDEEEEDNASEEDTAELLGSADGDAAVRGLPDEEEEPATAVPVRRPVHRL